MAPHQTPTNDLRAAVAVGINDLGQDPNKPKELLAAFPKHQPKIVPSSKARNIEIINISDFGHHPTSEQTESSGDIAANLDSFRKEVINSFLKTNRGTSKNANLRMLPSLLLYDEAGLKLFEDVTYLKEYYLTNSEIEVLETYGTQIAERILGNEENEEEIHIVELGSGNLRKVSILLLALLRLLKQPATKVKQVIYYALDVSLSELQRTFSQLPEALIDTDLVTCKALHGTYNDSLKWIPADPSIKDKRKCIIWLGSSIGNFESLDAGLFLDKIARECLNPGDTVLIGIDSCRKPEKLLPAYNDPTGVSRAFILNALQNANSVLGAEVFKRGEWEFLGAWNAEVGRYESYCSALKDIVMDGQWFDNPGTTIQIKKGEKVKVEHSHKYGETDKRRLWQWSGLTDGGKWTDSSGEYFLHMAYKPLFKFLSSPEDYAPLPFPKISEWRELWKAWDIVSLGMIPKAELSSRPIDLRNSCIFYLGHIPSFLDVRISQATGTPIVGKESYLQIFERGMDPDVDDPKICHPHSKPPEAWPDLEEILGFVKRLRTKVEDIYTDDGEGLREELFKDGEVKKRVLQRVLWMTFEHETMHLETFLYMLIQSDATLSPPGIVKPDFLIESRIAGNVTQGDYERQYLKIPDQMVAVGMDDVEDEDFVDSPDQTRFFGWDNEKPGRKEGIHVKSFLTSAGPITNADYLNFLTKKAASEGKSHLDMEIPASWKRTSFDELDTPSHYTVRTVFGPVPLAHVLQWPVVASYDELASCAAFYGGRIPTADEVRAIYKYARQSRNATLKPQNVDARTINAVNGHLSMNGVEESPPLNSARNLEENRKALFEDFSGAYSAFANVGFRKWNFDSVQPQSKDIDVKDLRGRGETGGAWEWTSTTFDKRDGFIVGRMYPNYSADFFDGKHNIVLGGSWATHPRVAGRKSFVNWYQRKYRYAWCTARIVRDIDV